MLVYYDEARDAILTCLHGDGNSWLGKRFSYSQLLNYKPEDGQNGQIVVNYKTEVALSEALKRLKENFDVIRVTSSEFRVGNYSCLLRVRKHYPVTNFDSMGYEPKTHTLVTGYSIDFTYFREKKCLLTRSLESIEAAEEEEKIHCKENLLSYINNGWSIYGSFGRKLRFLPLREEDALVPSVSWRMIEG